MRLDVQNFIERCKIMNSEINKSEIAKRFNCDVRTVNRYLTTQNPSERKPRVLKSLLDDYKSIIQEKVDLYGSTAKSVYDLILDKGYKGKYSLVKSYIRKHKIVETKKATLRFETIPGKQGQVDWKERKRMVNRKGEVFTINIFLFILGYSRYKYWEVTEDRSQSTLFNCLTNAFKYIDGVPQEILFDNMKTVVDRHRTIPRQVHFNSKFIQFSKDFHFTPKACMPYRPQTKGKVEAFAKLSNRLDAYNGEFDTFEDLQKIVKEMNKRLNSSVSQATGVTPEERLKKEKDALIPLSENKIINLYQQKFKLYKVGKDCMIRYKGKSYSVPIAYINKELSVIVTRDGNLNIFYDSEMVTTHKISNGILHYKKQHLYEIMKSDAYKNRSDADILHMAEAYLKQLSVL